MLESNIPETKPFKAIKFWYLLLAIAGSIAPWFWFIQDPAALASPSLFMQKAFANNISIALSNDLLVTGIAFFSFVWLELKRLEVSRLWILLYIGLTLGIGLSCSVPFFLYRREQIIGLK
jgi:hypothetical protein